MNVFARFDAIPSTLIELAPSPYSFIINILSSTANATLCLNFNNNFRFRSMYLQFGVDVAKPFSEMPCENQT